MSQRVFLAFSPGYIDPTRTGAAERVVFVREGFEPLAVVLTLPWLLFHRVWLGAVLYLAVVVGLQVVLWLTGAGAVVGNLALVLVGLAFGFEASALRQWALRRRGYVHAASVLAPTRAEAELRFFRDHRHLPPAPRVPGAPAEVLGQFPVAGRRA